MTSEITFLVEPQGSGWLAQCVEHSIVTEADSLDLLQPQIQDAVIDRGVALIISTCATKEELQREINAMTTRFIRWIAFIASAAVAALKYLP